MDTPQVTEHTRAMLAILMHKDVKPEKVQQVYSEWVNEYEEGMLSKEYGKLLTWAVDQFSQLFIDKTAKVLDIGAGTGLLGHELQKVGFTNIDGVDLNEDMLKVAREKNIYTNLIRDKLGKNRLSINDDTYDGLIGTGVFLAGHVTETCFEELIRITKPGGTIFMVIGSSWLEAGDALSGLEPEMGRLCEEGKWKLIRKDTGLRNYSFKKDGVCFVLQVN